MMEFNVLPSNGVKVYNTLHFMNRAYKSPEMVVLFDTGAFMSVWVDGIELFLRRFPDAKRTDTQAILRGFGTGYEVAPVYTIPEYRIMDESGQCVTIKNLFVAVIKRDFSFQMILSFPLFSKMNYHYISYTDRGGSVKSINPRFRLYPKQKLYCMNVKVVNVNAVLLKELEKKYPGITPQIKAKTIVHSAYIFTQ